MFRLFSFVLIDLNLIKGMILKFFIAGLLALICSGLYAQTGSYFLSHYTPPDKRIDFRSKAMVQDGQGEIYFATKAGVLEFDGLNWKVIRVPASVYALRAHNTEVLIGGLKGFGRLASHSHGPRTYELLSDVPGIFSSETDNDYGYLCNAEKIFIYSFKDQAAEYSIETNLATGNFLGLFKIGEDVVVRTETNRLFKIKEGKLVSLDFAITNLIFSKISPDKNATLIGTEDNRVYVVRNNTAKELTLQESDYLTHNILVDGVWVSTNVIALGTLRGGVIFINVDTGATEQIINYASGLPDNEVFALMTDRHQGVWVAHEYGFSRIAPQIPFRSFDHYTGLQGNLQCVQTFKGNLYVGTSLGLFMLNSMNPEFEEASAPGKKSAVKKTATTATNIRSHDAYRYQKIEGVEGKVNQLTEINGALYASGVGGVYEVNEDIAKRVVQEPVHYLQVSGGLNQVIVATLNKHIRTYIAEKGGWKETHLLDELTGDITYIFEDKLKNIWLCAGNSIYVVALIDGVIDDVNKYPIQNPMLDETLGFSIGSDTYIVSSGQFKKFNGKGFDTYDSLSSGGKYFASAGNFWFNDGVKWRSINRNANTIKLEWLGVFSGLRFLSWDTNNQVLWVITDKNELYKFIKEQTDSGEILNPLFLREVRGNEIKMARVVEVEQNKGAFTFEFVQPDFVGARATLYRYQVKGLSNEWSPWSTSNNVIHFSYLPAGSYTLAVQSKDLLGAESDIEQIPFKVLLPYWKRWWFYALEFVVFSFLVAGSIKLALGDSRYRFLSEILAILTVIMLIQFIQTVIYSLIRIDTSPVV